MNEQQRERMRQKLVELHEQLTGKQLMRVEPNRTDEERVGGDEDAQPLNEMLQAIASNRNRNTEGMLQRVLKALAKLRKDPDSFGECEECGDELPLGRLEAMPYAELCVNCQGSRDNPKGRPTRTKLTDYR